MFTGRNLTASTWIEGIAPDGTVHRFLPRHADGTLRTLHLVANPLVEVAADRSSATCRSRYVVLQATASLPLQAIVAGRYFDRFERDDAWRFAERAIEIDLVGNLSEHLRFDLERMTRGGS